MYGAILGDIAGSRYEFSKPKGFNPKTVALFDNLSRFTDDTVLTVATKYALLKGLPYGKAYGYFGRKYPKAGYGNMFRRWMMNHSAKPYHSFGNGAAMRVSFVAYYFQGLEAVEREAAASAMCTHDHPDGVRGAQAVAAAIYLARTGERKKEIVRYLRRRYRYQIRQPVAMYRPFGKFDATANGSIPLAIRCFLESDNWESCIRLVLSVKCDTDTVACIAGGIAEAFYGETGFDAPELLKRYLILPDEYGRFDHDLYDWAVKVY